MFVGTAPLYQFHNLNSDVACYSRDLTFHKAHQQINPRWLLWFIDLNDLPWRKLDQILKWKGNIQNRCISLLIAAVKLEDIKVPWNFFQISNGKVLPSIRISNPGEVFWRRYLRYWPDPAWWFPTDVVDTISLTVHVETTTLRQIDVLHSKIDWDTVNLKWKILDGLILPSGYRDQTYKEPKIDSLHPKNRICGNRKESSWHPPFDLNNVAVL